MNTLNHNDALSKLIALTGKTKTELTHRIITRLEDADISDGSEEECGKTVGTLIKEVDGNLTAVTLFVLGKSTNQLKGLFSEILIWGIEDQCPDCGCMIEYEPWQYGKAKGENESCVNCDFTFNTEPDF